jgi:hypothetical protein
MRRILVEAARREQRDKHGSQRKRIDLACAGMSPPFTVSANPRSR